MRSIAIVALAVLAFVGPAITQPVFRVPVRIVEVPVTVTGSDGKMIRGLTAEDFSLFDNDTAQRFHSDEAGQAFSLAIAVQNNSAVRGWLPQVNRSASALEALLLGAQGEASVYSFADDVTLVQRMTSDTGDLDRAIRGLKPSGSKSRCVDAVLGAARALSEVPAGPRRILLLIGQQGDIGSTAQIRDAVAEVERANVTVYCLAIPRVGKDLLGSVRVSGLGSQGGRDTGFVVSADLTKLVPEIYRASKAANGEDAVSLLTTYSGGRTIPFRGRRDLDAAISAIGEELHTGYVLTYTPNDSRAGYHRIRVGVGVEKASVRARPGYFSAE